MNQTDFNEVINDTWQNIAKLLRVKGGEYAGSEDRLANFKRGQLRTGAHPYQVLWIYLSKHIDSVETFIKDTANGTTRERSEPIDGRLDDIINYCLLMKALVKETQNEKVIEDFQDWPNTRNLDRSQPQGESGKMLVCDILCDDPCDIKHNCPHRR